MLYKPVIPSGLIESIQTLKGSKVYRTEALATVSATLKGSNKIRFTLIYKPVIPSGLMESIPTMKG